MITTKITRLAVIALLALGVSSPARAYPVIEVFYGTDLVSDSIRDYNFSISYTKCDHNAVLGAPCSGGVGNMVNFDVNLAATEVFQILSVTTDPGWFSPFFDDPGFGDDGLVAVESETFGGVGPFQLFNLTVQVNFGDFSESPNGPFFDFYTGVDSDGFPLFNELLIGVMAQFDPSLGTEDDVSNPVPEPGTLALLGLGLLGMSAARRRKIKN